MVLSSGTRQNTRSPPWSSNSSYQISSPGYTVMSVSGTHQAGVIDSSSLVLSGSHFFLIVGTVIFLSGLTVFVMPEYSVPSLLRNGFPSWSTKWSVYGALPSLAGAAYTGPVFQISPAMMASARRNADVHACMRLLQ